MRNRLFARAVVLLALTIVVFASLRIMGPSGRGISWGGYEAIRKDMNRYDVEAIMGRPPAGMIGVFFEAQGGTAQTVGAYYLEPLLSPEESIHQRIRRWFGF